MKKGFGTTGTTIPVQSTNCTGTTVQKPYADYTDCTSILNRTVSYFPSVTATGAGVDVNLLTLLQSDKHRDIITYLRGCEDAEARRIKSTLPCYTVAGTFSTRSEAGLLTLSGLACVDLDSAEDYDTLHLLHELRKLPCIAYAGLSCSGRRLFAIVPFLHPDRYVKHYEMLIKSFERAGLPMGDNCHKQISQPRFVSWNDDSTQFFNHAAKPYSLLPAERTYHIPKMATTHRHSRTAMPEHPFGWCMEQISKSYSFTDGSRHDYMMHLARYCNIKGLPEPETLSGCLQFIQDDFTEREIRDIVRHVYDHHRDSHNKRPFTAQHTHNTRHTVTPEPPQPEPGFEPLEYSDILDVHLMLNEIEGRGTTVPPDVWADFWNIHGNHNDSEAWRRLIQFISLN